MKRIFLTAISLSLCALAHAGQCELNITVIPPVEGKAIPTEVGERLATRLSSILAETGVSTSSADTQFFLTGRFDNSFTDRTNGREVVVTTLTLYIGDADNQKMYATKSFELKGVGKSETQAYNRAIESIKPGRRDIADFIENGKDKIIGYYNDNYAKMLTRARAAMKSRNYDEALYYVTSIPECCIGFNEAQSLAIEIYSQNADYIGRRLLAEAKAAFGAKPDRYGAERALSLIALIDPDAACYSEAMAYATQISERVKNQWDFNEIQKYKDMIETRHKIIDNKTEVEKARIESARAVGEAWAKTQPSARVYHNWY